ncbi:GNAT family N-acetyltransferase [Streptomyces sp. NPDC058067]|uniref:GNAT family N-acetyltransferase n=1 Tax=Streptomyces sp. NPDC058067 TaxID=3346324 RepID=UPI0036E390A9
MYPQPEPLITRIAERQWQALDDDRLVGDAEAWRRRDGRLFLAVDSWHDAAFAPLVNAMLSALPSPLHTIVDASDAHLNSLWERAGFTPRRREGEYVVPTDVDVLRLPSGVTILPFGAAEPGPLEALDRAVRAEVAAGIGWQEMPAEVLPRHDDSTEPVPPPPVDPSRYAVAVEAGQYVGLIRVAPVPRQPRIGLVAVRAGQQRRGIARALLGHVLESLHRSGVPRATAEISETNAAAAALFHHFGAQRVATNLELVYH